MKNHLQHELSPYLLQHAGNPVDWYPWGEEAFRKARKGEKTTFYVCTDHSCLPPVNDLGELLDSLKGGI